MGRLAGQSALVTGASRGVGRAVAATLAREGAELVVSSRGGRGLQAVAEETGASAVEADLGRLTELDRLVERVLDRFGGPPDILVNAAGCLDRAPLTELPLADFERHLRVNLIAPFVLIRALLPGMLSRGSGHLIQLGPLAAPEPVPGGTAYRASKGGLCGLHEVLRLELVGTGVRAGLVEPSEAAPRPDGPGAPWHAAPGAEAVARAVLDRLLGGEQPGPSAGCRVVG